MDIQISLQKTILATLVAIALPAAAQVRERSWDHKHTHAVEHGETKVIALHVWADPFGREGAKRYDVVPNNRSVEVAAGEKLRLTLVGTGIFDGEGREVPVRASFEVAAGRGDLHILRTGGNWVEVEVERSAPAIAGQIGFRVGAGYDLRGGMQTGRITLETHGTPAGTDRPSQADSRRQKSQAMASVLLLGILDTTFDARRDADVTDEIARYGYSGIQSAAENLAQEALRRRIAVDPDDSVRRLYRILLRRESTRIDSDPGFAANVDLMRRRGFREVVKLIVGSEEFRRVHDLENFGPEVTTLYQRDPRSGR